MKTFSNIFTWHIDPKNKLSLKYANYLKSEKKYDEALVAFEKALQAPARVNREIADQGRKKEVESAILEIKNMLEDKNSKPYL